MAFDDRADRIEVRVLIEPVALEEIRVDKNHREKQEPWRPHGRTRAYRCRSRFAMAFPLCNGAAIIGRMLRRTFGDTNLEVSAISLGCWIFGVDWWGHYTDERGVELCQFAYDQGVTFFDNGDAYGNGRAETILGKWIRESGVPRDRIEIGGKFGYDFYS